MGASKLANVQNHVHHVSSMITQATGHDYETAQTLRVKGLSYKEISERLHIPLHGLLKYGKRHGWDKTRTKAVQLVSDIVQTEMATRALKHVTRIADLADKAIENVIARDLDNMDIDSLSKLASIANTFDLMGRRAYKLDDDKAAKHSSLVQVNVQSNGSVSTFAGPIAHVLDSDQDQEIEEMQVLDAQQLTEPTKPSASAPA